MTLSFNGFIHIFIYAIVAVSACSEKNRLKQTLVL
jgi:hypothetical protein